MYLLLLEYDKRKYFIIRLEKNIYIYIYYFLLFITYKNVNTIAIYLSISYILLLPIDGIILYKQVT